MGEKKDISGTNGMVGVGRIELPTSCSQSRRPTAGLHPVVSEFIMPFGVIRFCPKREISILCSSPGSPSDGELESINVDLWLGN